MSEWNNAFENAPANSDDAGNGAQDIRIVKQEVGNRLEREHLLGRTIDTEDGLHCVDVSGYFKVRNRTNDRDIFIVDDVNKLIKPGTGLAFADANGNSVAKRLRAIGCFIAGDLIIGRDFCPLLEFPTISTDTIKIKEIKARVKTAPIGAALIVVLKKYTNAQVPTDTPTTVTTCTISAGAFVGTATVDISVNYNDYFVFEITQVGSTTPGADLTAIAKAEF